MLVYIFYFAWLGFAVCNIQLQKEADAIDIAGTQRSKLKDTMTASHADHGFSRQSPTLVARFNYAGSPKKANVTKSRLPTLAHFDHTVRPGLLQWKSPPPKPAEGKLFPVYRLPISSDDEAQVRLEWSFVDLKVRPEKLTIEAIGPNKATWSVTVLEDGLATSATWHLRETPSYSPLIEGFYTLQIHDQRGPSAPPTPGWLLADHRMTIGLYKPELDHVGQVLAVSECATCFNYIMKDIESHTASNPLKADFACLLGFLLTSVVIVLG